MCVFKFFKGVIIKLKTNSFQKAVVKIKIMHNAKPHGKHFFAFEKVSDIGA